MFVGFAHTRGAGEVRAPRHLGACLMNGLGTGPFAGASSSSWLGVNENCDGNATQSETAGSLTPFTTYTVDPTATLFGPVLPPLTLTWSQFLIHVGSDVVLEGVTFEIKASWYLLSSLVASSTAARLVVRASGTKTGPLTIRGERLGPGTLGALPDCLLLGDSAWQDDSSAPFGLVVEGSHYLRLEAIGIVGCGNGVLVRGAARYVSMSDLHIASNAQRGVWITATASGDATDQGCDSAEVGGEYPACILIERSNILNNGCGCDSAATQVMIGACATNVTVRCCDIYCYQDDRGSDGITFAAASSGHVIERNLIHDIPRLHTGDCAPNCNDSGDTSDGDGIDMKGVWPRTPESGELTIIRHNVIYRCGGTGITIQAASRHVHCYENEIFCVNTGIYLKAGSLQSEPENGTTATDEVEVSQLYLYRNIIYCVEAEESGGDGIQIDLEAGMGRYGDDDGGALPSHFSLRLSDIVVAHNTLDRVAEHGLALSRVEDAELPEADVTFTLEDLVFVNNIFGRCRRNESDPDDKLGYLNISRNFELADLGTTTIDGNLYAFAAGDLAASRWATEPRNAQIVNLPDVGWVTIWELWHSKSRNLKDHGFEQSWMGRGDDPSDQYYQYALNPYQDFTQVADDSDYHLVGGSPALGTAVVPVGLTHRELVSTDISGTLDFYRQRASSSSDLFVEPDVGAVESDEAVPDVNEPASTSIILQPPTPPLGARLHLGALLRDTERLFPVQRLS